MILLETPNRIVKETVQARLDSEKQVVIDVTCADFDGVKFHIATNPDAPNLLTISVSIKCFHELKNFGVEDALKKVYGDLYQSSPESGYDATLQIDLNNKPAKKDIADDIALLKRHCMASVFNYVFDGVEKKTIKNEIITINYRDDEAMYFKISPTSLVLIYSISFKDADDVIFSKVFLQEFANVRAGGAPKVTFSQREPPNELDGVSGVVGGDDNGFVSFAIFAEHFTARRRDKTINQLLMFRNYLHYHIKCSKAYLHERMRNRVNSLLLLMNRAKVPAADDGTKKVKTFSGKTFVRK